jgi:hypothetical protein
MSDLKPNIDHIVMDEDGLFFAGMSRGSFIWSEKIEDAKPIHTELQLNNLKLWSRKDLIWDSVLSPRGTARRRATKKKL